MSASLRASVRHLAMKAFVPRMSDEVFAASQAVEPSQAAEPSGEAEPSGSASSSALDDEPRQIASCSASANSAKPWAVDLPVLQL